MFVDFGSMPQDQMTFQQQFPQLFQAGLADQKEKKWDDAVGKYQALLDQSQNNLTNEQASVVYHNMAASYFEKADFVRSFIWSKKALSLNSDNDFSKTLLSEVTKKFQAPQIPHQISATESFKNAVLDKVTVDSLLIGSFILFAFTLHIGTKAWILRRRLQLESETASVQKKYPVGLTIAFVAVGFLTLAFCAASFAKWKDNLQTKAIVSAEKAPVQTAPGGSQAVIYDATAGLEVDVLKIENDFVQIRYPGAFSGWVEKKNLEILKRTNWP